MSLSLEIKKFQKEFLSQVPNEILDQMLSATERLIASGLSDKALKKGGVAPDFTLPNATGKSISSTDLLKDGPLVLSFYRGGWCPYCNLEFNALQKALPEIETLGAKLIAISPETPDNALTTAEKHNLRFEVLSDVGNKLARDFGLVFALAEELRPIYKSFGIDISAYNGDELYELPIPATYIINSDRTIRYSFVNADYTQRAEPSEILEALRR